MCVGAGAPNNIPSPTKQFNNPDQNLEGGGTDPTFKTGKKKIPENTLTMSDILNRRDVGNLSRDTRCARNSSEILFKSHLNILHK